MHPCVECGHAHRERLTADVVLNKCHSLGPGIERQQRPRPGRARPTRPVVGRLPFKSSISTNDQVAADPDADRLATSQSAKSLGQRLSMSSPAETRLFGGALAASVAPFLLGLVDALTSLCAQFQFCRYAEFARSRPQLTAAVRDR